MADVIEESGEEEERQCGPLGAHGVKDHLQRGNIRNERKGQILRGTWLKPGLIQRKCKFEEWKEKLLRKIGYSHHSRRFLMSLCN